MANVVSLSQGHHNICPQVEHDTHSAFIALPFHRIDHPAGPAPPDDGRLQAPECVPGLAPTEQQTPQPALKLKDLQQRVEQLQEKLVSKSAISYFVPCSALRPLLKVN